jgi:hypothetical protein
MRYLAPAVPLSIVLLATLTCTCSSGRNATEAPEAGVDGGAPDDAADAGTLDASEGG